MASESVMGSNDLSLKRQREEEENGVSVSNGVSAVIPGWFSEISPMWPGLFFSYTLLSDSFKVLIFRWFLFPVKNLFFFHGI